MGIYKFIYKNSYLILDVNSSNIFKSDKIMFDILDYYPHNSEGEVIRRYKGIYSQKAISEVIGEIDELMAQGKLYTRRTPSELHDLVKTGPVKAMCLNVTHDCNLACEYCFASGGDFDMDKEFMTEETAKHAVDFLIEQSKGRINLEIDFFGGEPLMNFEVIKATVAYARSLEETHNKRFRFTMTTNAVLLTPKMMDFINEEMSNLVLSIDGRPTVNDAMRHTTSGKGSYTLIKDKILTAVAMRGDKDYYVRATYTNKNLDFSADVVHLAQLGIKNISEEPVVSSPDEPYAIREEHLPRILEEYDKLVDVYLSYRGTDKAFNFFHFNLDLENEICIFKRISGCGAACDYVAVAPNGDIYPCHQFVGKPDFVLGNLNDRVLDREIQSKFSDLTVLTKCECSSCWARYFCGGGCHASAYNLAGSLDDTYKLGCEMFKKRLECALYIKSISKSLNS
jgi:uncharacterized protein